MSQPGDLEPLSPRFLEVEEGLHRREPSCRSLPRLGNITSSTFQVEGAVTLYRQTSRNSSCGSASPRHAGVHDKLTGSLSYGDVHRATSLSIPACSDAQEEAATPSHRLSGTQGAPTPTALADIISTPSTPCTSPPGALPRLPDHQQHPSLVEASPPPSPLSLSHPVVEFLASVQLQGYAAHIMCNAGIRSMLELVAHAATSKGVAELLGPLASMQQQNELLRGIRRWQRDEARRLKAEATEARRRVQKGCHNSNIAPRDLSAKKKCARAVKAGGNVTTSAGTEAVGGGEPESNSAIHHFWQSGGHCGAIGGCARMRSSTGCDCALQQQSSTSACGTANSSSHAVLSGYSEAVASPQPGPLTSGVTSSVSFSCPPLTTSATQLMQQLSYRCSHSRQARARGHRAGLRRSRPEPCSHQGEAVDVIYPKTINVIPYDVDAEDADIITPTATAGSGASSPRQVSNERIFSRSRERSLPHVDLTEGRGACVVGADEESLPNYGQREGGSHIMMENRDESEVASPYFEEIGPLAALSPSSFSGESRLSSILSSLYEAAERQPAALQQNGFEGADREGPASAPYALAGVGGPSGGLESPPLGCVPATIESQDVVHNKFLTTSNISLGALSASAELQVLAPLNLVMPLVRQRPLPPGDAEADGVISADGNQTEVTKGAKESDAVCSSSQPHRQQQDDRSVANDTTSERSRSAQQHPLDDMYGNLSVIDKTLGPMSFLDDQLADARRRLSDALHAALQSYNDEVRVIEKAAASPSRGTSAIDRCAPLCAVLHPIRLPLSASCMGASGTEAEELEAPTKLVYVLQGSGGTTQVSGPGCPSCSPTTVTPVAESGWCSAGGLLAADRVGALSLDQVVLSSMTSTDPSARTKVISTAAPESLSCPSTLPPVATAAKEWPTVAGGVDAPAAAQAMPSSSRCSGERGSVSCESLGLLTVGTQRPSKHVSMADPGLALEESTTLHVDRVSASGLDDCVSVSLWVAQGSSSRNQKSFSGDAATGDVDRKEVVPNDDEWWESYGIEALEYTQNCVEDSVIGRDASPGVHTGQPHPVSSDAAGVLASGVQTPSPAPVEVMELSSDTDTDVANSSVSGGRDDAYSRFPVAASRLSAGTVSAVPPRSLSAPRDSVARCPTSPSCRVPVAPIPSSLSTALDPRLHAEAWSRMSNAELRDLCREFGLSVPPSMPLPPRQAATASIGVTASPSSPTGVCRRGRSVPFFSPEVYLQTLRGTATARDSSPEWNLLELPTTAASGPRPCREAVPSSTDVREGAAQPSTALSPIPILTQAEHGYEGGGSGCPVDSVVSASCAMGNRPRGERRAALMEREALLEALRLLSTRLCFRHKVAPFFLHRVTRLSGLPYKRIRVGDRIDEGAVLTHDELKRVRLRYKAEEQAEVDRCIVSALAAEAAEAVEQEAHRVAARWTMTSPSTSATKDGSVAEMEMSTMHSALVSLPDGGTLATYNKILLREPVDVDTAVAAVQSSFPHISHTRVQQLLSANEVLAEAVATPSPCSPSPLPSSPLFPLSSTMEPDAEQRFALPNPSDELAGAVSQQSVAGGSRLVHATETERPLSQGERRRVNTRRFFAQRGHLTRRRQSAWGHGLLRSGRSFGTLGEIYPHHSTISLTGSSPSIQAGQMSSTYTADAWERDKLSQSSGAATDNVEMEGRGGDLAQQKKFAHTAPAAKRGLMVSNDHTGGAVVAACQPASFSGLYETVEFPVSTLFAPPRPPSELPPRVKRPARPGPVYANDIATAGELQHRAQREVSRMWRGVLCRRRLRQAHTLNEILNSRARRIQCWWRSLNARWRRRRLEAIRDGWAKERMENYIAERIVNMKNILHWQWHRYEVAAQLIQQVVRWYLRERQRYRCAAEGLPESVWPPALAPYPFRRRRPYFPWRFALVSKALADRPADLGEEGTDSEAEQPTRTLLRFRPFKNAAVPPTQEEVEAANVKMWERNLKRALALSTPEALSRAEWKTENLHHEDLDFNAGLVQRVYLSKKAFTAVRTKQLKEEYMKKVTRIIGRTFSMYVLVKRIQKQRAMRQRQVRALIDKHNAQKIKHLEVEAVWQRELMDACAICIQRCWHWYRSVHRPTSPREDEASTTLPARPPYGLIDAQIKREREIKWSSMNLMQRHEKRREREHKYLRYVPKQTLVYKKTGRFLTESLKK